MKERAGKGIPGTAAGVYDVEGIVDLLDGAAQAVEEEKVLEAAEEASGAALSAEEDVPMPEGWEERVWLMLTPEARQAVDAGEKAHAHALAALREEQEEQRRRHERFAVEAYAQIRRALSAMKQIVEGEYGAVDWQNLAQNDPAAYVRLQQAYATRMEAIRRVQKSVAEEARRYEEQRRAEARRVMEAECAVVRPEIMALMGSGFNAPTFASDLAAYMKEQGCPAEAINGLSRGYELKLVTKAMLFDRMQARRREAARKLAEAPGMSKPRFSAGPVGEDRTRRARARLEREPDSTDALAALFETVL